MLDAENREFYRKSRTVSERSPVAVWSGCIMFAITFLIKSPLIRVLDKREYLVIIKDNFLSVLLKNICCDPSSEPP